MTEFRYIEGDTVRVDMLAEVVHHTENAITLAFPGVDEPVVVPVRCDDGGPLTEVYIEPSLPDVQVGDLYQARLTGGLWMAANTAVDQLADADIKLVSPYDGRGYDPGWVAREYGPLRRVLTQADQDRRPVMFHLPAPDLATDGHASPGLLPLYDDEDAADPLPVPTAIDPAAAVAVAPLPADSYAPPLPPPSIVLASASTAPGEVDDPTVPVSPINALVADKEPRTLNVRTIGVAATHTYLVPVLPDGDAARTAAWDELLVANGWERTGGWRRTSADDGWRAPVRPAKQPEQAGDPAKVGEVAA